MTTPVETVSIEAVKLYARGELVVVIEKSSYARFGFLAELA